MNKSLKNKKSMVAIIAILALALIGGTFAFFHAELSADNKLSTGGYGVKMVEKFKAPENWEPGQEVEKKVTFTNEKANKVVLRVKAEEAWGANEEKDSVNVITVKGNDKNFESNKVAKVGNAGNINDWIYDNGYWYYTNVMENGDSVDFLDSVTLSPDFISNDSEVVKEETNKDGETTITAKTKDGSYELVITGEFVQPHKDALADWSDKALEKLNLQK